MQVGHLQVEEPASSTQCTPQDFLTACKHPAVANVLEWLAESGTLPPEETPNGPGSMRWTLAAMYTICKRANVSQHELTVSTMYAVIWILRSIDSQSLSWAHHTVKEFLEAAELHSSRPVSPQDHEDCLAKLIRMQAQLLKRCNWQMSVHWEKDAAPSLQQLATCPAQGAFQWICSLGKG